MSVSLIENVDLKVEQGLLRHKAIRWLVGSHVFVGVVLTILSAIRLDIAAAILIILVSVQANLLGGWASLSRETVAWRIMGLILAAISLSLELALASGFKAEVEFYIMLFGLAFGTGAFGLIARSHFGPLRFYDPSTLQQLATKWQFSIRQLMILTFVVCSALASARCLESMNNPFVGKGMGVVVFCFLIFLGVICFWAMLRIPMPWFRSLGALSLAIFLSYLWSILIRDSWFAVELFIVMTIYMASYVLLTLLSLYIICRCGYRLIRAEDLPTDCGQ